MTTWNRYLMYDYLKTTGMKLLTIRTDKKKYHMEFVLDQTCQKYCEVITDWGYVRGVETIALCRDEVVLISNNSMKVNIKYKHMDKFEVHCFEEGV